MATANGVQLFVEDKAAGGRFTRGQTEAYESMTRESNGAKRSVLIAPRSFLDSHRKDAQRFSGDVSLEELATDLEAGAPVGSNAEAELSASYRHRAQNLRRCADSAAPSPIDPASDEFGSAYRALAANRAEDRIRVGPGSMKRARTHDIEFLSWAWSDGTTFQPYHKLDLGRVDFPRPRISGRGAAVAGRRSPSGETATTGMAPGQPDPCRCARCSAFRGATTPRPHVRRVPSRGGTGARCTGGLADVVEKRRRVTLAGIDRRSRPLASAARL